MIKSSSHTQQHAGNLYIVKGPETAAPASTIYQQVFNASLQPGIITIMATAHIVSVNKAACKLLGYTAKELSCETRDDIFLINDRNFKAMLRQRKEKPPVIAQLI